MVTRPLARDACWPAQNCSRPPRPGSSSDAPPSFPAAYPDSSDPGRPHRRGVAFAVNGARIGRTWPVESALIAVRLARKRKPSAAGYLVRDRVPLPEEQRGLAIAHSAR